MIADRNGVATLPMATAGRAAVAIIVLVALLGLIAVGLSVGGVSIGADQGATTARGGGDLGLYARAIARVRGDEAYHAVMTEELRAHHYPLRPAVAVRPPALTWALAALPGEGAARLVLGLLGAATFAAWAWRLDIIHRAPLPAAASLAVLASGIAPAFMPSAYLLHETWAGLLIALSLALRSPRRWIPSVFLGLAAMLTRELAAPFLVAMAVLALRDDRRREACAWGAALIVGGAALAAHLAAAQPYILPDDPTSPGWLALGGWPFVLQTQSWNALLDATPPWLAAVVGPLALLGLCQPCTPNQQRLALTVLGYSFAFMVVGRADNAYWGLLIAPLWPLGLMTIAALLRDLADAIVRFPAAPSR